MQLKGFRFFADDEDEFQLEDILQVGGRAGGWAGGRVRWAGVLGGQAICLQG